MDPLEVGADGCELNDDRDAEAGNLSDWWWQCGCGGKDVDMRMKHGGLTL